MNNSKLVSIIVPVYNVENYLVECVDSLVMQTYSNIEIILVDDGSKDLSGKICDELAASDARIRVVHKVNGGLSSARNAGMEVAKADFYTFVDSDDTVTPDFVETCIFEMEKYSSDIVSFNMSSERTNLKVGFPAYTENMSVEEALYCIFAEEKMTTSASGKLYRADLWSDIRFPEGFIFEDFGTIYKVFLKAKSICVSQESKYYYRPNPTGITGSKFTAKRMQYFQISDHVRNDVEKCFPKLIQNIDRRAVRYAISFFRDMAASNVKDPAIEEQLRQRICGRMWDYICHTKYSIFSKLYGLAIVIWPQFAIWVFGRKK